MIKYIQVDFILKASKRNLNSIIVLGDHAKGSLPFFPFSPPSMDSIKKLIKNTFKTHRYIFTHMPSCFKISFLSFIQHYIYNIYSFLLNMEISLLVIIIGIHLYPSFLLWQWPQNFAICYSVHTRFLEKRVL